MDHNIENLNDDENVGIDPNEKIENTTDVQKNMRLIYCGPNIYGGRLLQYTAFKGGYPEHLSDIFEKCPAVKELLVPIENFTTTMAKIQKKGTEESRLFGEIIQFLQNKGV